jgi:hypothetical protein
VNGDAEDRPSGSRTPVWRLIAGWAVLAALASIGILLVPVYLHNFQLSKLLRTSHISSENAARQFVLDRGRSLGLDISPNQLDIRRLPGTTAIDVHYVVRVSFPLYTVDLHFSSTIAEVR